MQSNTNPFGFHRSRQCRLAVLKCLVALCVLACVMVALPVRGQTGNATNVPLLLPTTVVSDGTNTLYVTETNRHVVDRIDPSGEVSAVAGNGSQGFSGDGGPATSAQLDSPQGLAVDAEGNLYIADTHNQRVRMVAAKTSVITTIAGTGVAGFSGDQGQGVGARLNMPTALALDGYGNLDIADSNNHRIRQLTLSTGVIRTIAGDGTQGNSADGPALSGSIDTPSGLAVDASGNLYVADMHNRRVRRVAHDTGMMTTVVADGAATRLLLPRGLSVDSAGNLYITDTQAHRVLRVGADGTVADVAGDGTQGFAGDNGPAAAASLDRPRSVVVSSAGLITVADTGNQRVRQLTASGTVQTLGGIGQAGLSLSAPSVVLYGTGAIATTLSSGTQAAGTVSYFEASNGLLSLLGSASLAANAASFSTARLGAGSHRILATYAGDATHASVQSSVLALTVSPAQVSVSPTSAAILYGQPFPALTGTISGVLAQDAGAVTAVFATSAQELAGAGSYPIGASLTGTASGNYVIGSTTNALLTIAQAPTGTSLVATAASTPQSASGSAVTFTARAASTTQGVPTGRVSFLDGANAMGSSALDASGTGSLAATLSAGTHSVMAVYSGDGNFLASSSAAISQVVTGTAMTPASAEFSVAASGSPAQTASAGSSVSYPFSVTIQNGPLNSPILLTSSGMPPGATATFSPTYLPPGGTVSAFTLTVQTAKTSAMRRTSQRPVWAAMVWGSLALIPVALRRRRSLSALLGVIAVSLVAGCGDRVSSLPTAAKSSAVVYPMTVTATSTLASGAVLQHAVSVTLTLQ